MLMEEKEHEKTNKLESEKKQTPNEMRQQSKKKSREFNYHNSCYEEPKVVFNLTAHTHRLTHTRSFQCYSMLGSYSSSSIFVYQ